jgi:hypothetical protein
VYLSVGVGVNEARESVGVGVQERSELHPHVPPTYRRMPCNVCVCVVVVGGGVCSGVGKQVRGKRVLIMDEVDDTRTTLKYCVEEVFLSFFSLSLGVRPRVFVCSHVFV